MLVATHHSSLVAPQPLVLSAPYPSHNTHIVKKDILRLLIRRPVQQRLKQIRLLVRHRVAYTHPQRQPRRLAGVLQARTTRHCRRSKRVGSLGDLGVILGWAQGKHVAKPPVVVHGRGGGAQRHSQREESGKIHYYFSFLYMEKRNGFKTCLECKKMNKEKLVTTGVNQRKILCCCVQWTARGGMP